MKEIYGCPIKVYPAGVSITDDGFLRVWNGNTTEWNDLGLDELWAKIDWSMSISMTTCKQSVDDINRGTLAVNAGYSSQSYERTI